ncbi:acyl-homoserine lactone acylase PvdQ [Lacibacter cauensis]|uniref:Acyl-homoserine lactone acylase PvdQ n=1 Tax=Lacibacter cauensis TaxID=510947 RepID=A0A562SPA4_9BACT|nr:penicillin acylase family protein [Lacibacter cauensis]TWI83082.1 acyl-homoserine lactone acylase PvdQ [Lacibacter cauensis]
MRYFILLFLPFFSAAQPFSSAEIKKWQQQAAAVNIIRDNWGVPHVYGKTDADAVFGLLYAQCEDDFKRVEMNYIEKLGRKAEVLGETALYGDLYIRLLIDSAEAVADYNKAPLWLKQLMNAWADGINYYLYKHPEVKPALLTRFKPWYPLLWTDGSIGAISTGDVTEAEVKNFYSDSIKMSSAYINALKEEQLFAYAAVAENKQTDGSNGFAVAPSKTESGNAILYINPHTTFYFRPEVHMNSEQGLNVYGAVTWGQFFIYQGFNPYCGWMHTSSSVDVSDMYAEETKRQGSGYVYKYNKQWLPVKEKLIELQYKSNGQIVTKKIRAFYTHHGPVMAKRGSQIISVKSNNRDLKGLIQSWLRTKAKGLDDYKKVMDLQANTSNNTVFADYKGNIAYWHGNFVPVRDKNLNWGKVMDGTTTVTEWKGLHKVNETVHVYNPANGWIQNCNSTPFTVSGDASPKKKDYPVYMAPDGENFRGVNAVRVLSKENKFTIDKMIKAGYDTYLAAFEILVPALIKNYDASVTADNAFYKDLVEPMQVLKQWDYRVAENSVATALAIEWAQLLGPGIRKVYIEDGETDQVDATKLFADSASAAQLLNPLLEVVRMFQKRYGKWNVAWGEINRFQRVSNDIQQQYNDNKESVPVAFASSAWGMLPAYNSNYYPGTIKRYGTSGNSFICAVEFGKRIKAKSLLAGGVSGNVQSPHFNDQLLMYTKGQFKDVLFYKEDVLKHVERSYHPGE